MPATSASQERRRVRADADKGSLPKTGHAADARQQHQADRHDRIQANVVEQRHPILGQMNWLRQCRQRENHHEEQ
jgi:hypothetical protein